MKDFYSFFHAKELKLQKKGSNPLYFFKINTDLDGYYLYVSLVYIALTLMAIYGLLDKMLFETTVFFKLA